MEDKKTERLYITLVATPGIFAFLIRAFLKFEFIHVILGMDRRLTHCYSFGRRDPRIPILSGFEREEMDKVLRKFRNTRIAVYEIRCTPQQKAMVWKKIEYYMANRRRYKYAIIGIPFAALGIPFHQKRHYACSHFVARILEDCGIRKFDKHYSVMTPRDFYNMDDKKTIYIGSLRNFLEKQ